MDKNNLLFEAILLGSCNHPNLVGLYGVCYIENDFDFMVIEYMDMGDLLTYLRDLNVLIQHFKHLFFKNIKILIKKKR